MGFLTTCVMWEFVGGPLCGEITGESPFGLYYLVKRVGFARLTIVERYANEAAPREVGTVGAYFPDHESWTLRWRTEAPIPR